MINVLPWLQNERPAYLSAGSILIGGRLSSVRRSAFCSHWEAAFGPALGKALQELLSRRQKQKIFSSAEAVQKHPCQEGTWRMPQLNHELIDVIPFVPSG